MKLVDEKRQLQKFKSNLFYFGILSLVTVIVWVGFSVSKLYFKETTDSEIQSLIKPLKPSLESDVLEKFKQTRSYAPETFTIISKKKQGEEVTIEIIDPFSNSRSPASSPSAEFATVEE